MVTPEGLRDAILSYIADHEREGCQNSPTPGAACWVERANIIAFLCHSLGLRSVNLQRVLAECAQYDRACPGCFGCRVAHEN